MSHRLGKPTVCIGENKSADQLRSNCKADQHLCFCYTDSTIPLLSKSKISSLKPSSVTVQPCLCWNPNCCFSPAQAHVYVTAKVQSDYISISSLFAGNLYSHMRKHTSQFYRCGKFQFKTKYSHLEHREFQMFLISL